MARHAGAVEHRRSLASPTRRWARTLFAEGWAGVLFAFAARAESLALCLFRSSDRRAMVENHHVRLPLLSDNHQRPRAACAPDSTQPQVPPSSFGMSSCAASVAKVSPESAEVLDRIPVGDGPAGIAVGSARSGWRTASPARSRGSTREPAAREERSRSARAPTRSPSRAATSGLRAALRAPSYDFPARGGPVTAIDVVDSRPTVLAAVDGAIFVGLRPSGASHAGGTLRIVSGTSGPPLIDTAKAYSPIAWSTLILTNDGLVGWRRVGGNGVRPRPRRLAPLGLRRRPQVDVSASAGHPVLGRAPREGERRPLLDRASLPTEAHPGGRGARLLSPDPPIGAVGVGRGGGGGLGGDARIGSCGRRGLAGVMALRRRRRRCSCPARFVPGRTRGLQVSGSRRGGCQARAAGSARIRSRARV